ncbi:fructosamine kinase family protein [Corynebacterium evansiae]|uniref:Fructosamine kinase family protein n=1 Tax=Corynebacterium evansiae TaxID=2913499 RepID=A0A9X3LND2_9CORY|nr:fructosamine kinase family protein [Corynebacterium evansiae]MCZ9290335.1 fructosamine kinase family protein [Corynebacterium evansiae]
MAISDIYWKNNPGRPGAWEVAGLRWLAEAPGGAPVVSVHEHDARGLGIDRVEPMTPTRAMAEDFGRKLAATHAAGAPHFGFSPTGESGFQGPNDNLLELPLKPSESWGEFYADVCLSPLVAGVFGGASLAGTSQSAPGTGAGSATADVPAEVTRLLEALRAGQLDDGTPPARIHGDLWAGNVLWGKVASRNRASRNKEGGILIDPSAHGGHPRADLAALWLFGAPHLSSIEGAYFEASPHVDGWGTGAQSVDLHQQHLLWLHAAVFGGGYVGEAVAGAGRVVREL